MKKWKNLDLSTKILLGSLGVMGVSFLIIRRVANSPDPGLVPSSSTSSTPLVASTTVQTPPTLVDETVDTVDQIGTGVKDAFVSVYDTIKSNYLPG